MTRTDKITLAMTAAVTVGSSILFAAASLRSKKMIKELSDRTIRVESVLGDMNSVN